VDNAKLSITPQVDDIGPAPTIHQPVQAESPDLGQALMQAGFAMMAGRSPHALENIGAGAMSGMQNWNEQKKANADFANKKNDVQSKADQLMEMAFNHRKDEKNAATRTQNEADYQEELLRNDKEKIAQQAREIGLRERAVSQDQWQVIPDQLGGFLKYNKKTGETQALASPNDSGAAAIDKDGKVLTGDEYLATLPPQRAALIKALDEGRMNYPTSFAMAKPHWQQVMDQLNQYNPSASQQTAQAVRSFNTGKQGDITRFLNVAVNHLGTLGNLAEALNNNDVKALNQVGNVWQAQTGSPAPTNFNTAKQIVADEIIKSVVGAGGTGADRERAQAVIDAANSPEQLRGAINTYKELMIGQLGGLKQQYETSTGRKDYDKYLTDEAKKAFAVHRQQPQANNNSSLPKETGSSGIPTISDPSSAEFQSLPSGARFMTPDGKMRVKH